jgi:hypothetical protein
MRSEPEPNGCLHMPSTRPIQEGNARVTQACFFFAFRCPSYTPFALRPDTAIYREWKLARAKFLSYNIDKLELLNFFRIPTTGLSIRT